MGARPRAVGGGEPSQRASQLCWPQTARRQLREAVGRAGGDRSSLQPARPSVRPAPPTATRPPHPRKQRPRPRLPVLSLLTPTSPHPALEGQQRGASRASGARREQGNPKALQLAPAGPSWRERRRGGEMSAEGGLRSFAQKKSVSRERSGSNAGSRYPQGAAWGAAYRAQASRGPGCRGGSGDTGRLPSREATGHRDRVTGRRPQACPLSPQCPGWAPVARGRPSAAPAPTRVPRLPRPLPCCPEPKSTPGQPGALTVMVGEPPQNSGPRRPPQKSLEPR